jgi:hypothetical protein
VLLCLVPSSCFTAARCPCFSHALLQAGTTFEKPDEHFYRKIVATLSEVMQTWPCTLLSLHTLEESDLGVEISVAWWARYIQGWVLWSLSLHSFTLQQFFHPVLIVQSSCFSQYIYTYLWQILTYVKKMTIKNLRNWTLIQCSNWLYCSISRCTLHLTD